MQESTPGVLCVNFATHRREALPHPMRPARCSCTPQRKYTSGITRYDYGESHYACHKAVITAAGPNQDRLPLQRFVDLDGAEKTALEIILEEVAAAGVEEVCVVVRPGSQNAYREAAGDYARTLAFVEQPAPRGYGEALYRAAAFVGDQPFVHLVSDHLYVSRPAAALRGAVGRSRPGRAVLGLGGPAHAGEHAALLRRGGGSPVRRPDGAVPDRAGAGKAHAHRGRTAPRGAGAARRTLPLPVRHARALRRA